MNERLCTETYIHMYDQNAICLTAVGGVAMAIAVLLLIFGVLYVVINSLLIHGARTVREVFNF